MRCNLRELGRFLVVADTSCRMCDRWRRRLVPHRMGSCLHKHKHTGAEPRQYSGCGIHTSHLYTDQDLRWKRNNSGKSVTFNLLTSALRRGLVTAMRMSLICLWMIFLFIWKPCFGKEGKCNREMACLWIHQRQVIHLLKHSFSSRWIMFRWMYPLKVLQYFFIRIVLKMFLTGTQRRNTKSGYWRWNPS